MFIDNDGSLIAGLTMNKSPLAGWRTDTGDGFDVGFPGLDLKAAPRTIFTWSDTHIVHEVASDVLGVTELQPPHRLVRTFSLDSPVYPDMRTAILGGRVMCVTFPDEKYYKLYDMPLLGAVCNGALGRRIEWKRGDEYMYCIGIAAAARVAVFIHEADDRVRLVPFDSEAAPGARVAYETCHLPRDTEALGGMLYVSHSGITYVRDGHLHYVKISDMTTTGPTRVRRMHEGIFVRAGRDHTGRYLFALERLADEHRISLFDMGRPDIPAVFNFACSDALQDTLLGEVHGIVPIVVELSGLASNVLHGTSPATATVTLPEPPGPISFVRVPLLCIRPGPGDLIYVPVVGRDLTSRSLALERFASVVQKDTEGHKRIAAAAIVPLFLVGGTDLHDTFVGLVPKLGSGGTISYELCTCNQRDGTCVALIAGAGLLDFGIRRRAQPQPGHDVVFTDSRIYWIEHDSTDTLCTMSFSDSRRFVQGLPEDVRVVNMRALGNRLICAAADPDSLELATHIIFASTDAGGFTADTVELVPKRDRELYGLKFCGASVAHGMALFKNSYGWYYHAQVVSRSTVLTPVPPVGDFDGQAERAELTEDRVVFFNKDSTTVAPISWLLHTRCCYAFEQHPAFQTAVFSLDGKYMVGARKQPKEAKPMMCVMDLSSPDKRSTVNELPGPPPPLSWLLYGLVSTPPSSAAHVSEPAPAASRAPAPASGKKRIGSR